MTDVILQILLILQLRFSIDYLWMAVSEGIKIQNVNVYMCLYTDSIRVTGNLVMKGK